MPQELINAKPVSAVIKEFFCSSRSRSSWIRTTPSRKSRTSAASPRRARRPDARARWVRGRDVPPTHYGLVCPIETPRVRTSASSFAGGICQDQPLRLSRTPYRKVCDTKVTDRVEYLSAIEEGHS